MKKGYWIAHVTVTDPKKYPSYVAANAEAKPRDYSWEIYPFVGARSYDSSLGDVSDIVRAVRFLATDAPFVTGQVINVDGGRSLR